MRPNDFGLWALALGAWFFVIGSVFYFKHYYDRLQFELEVTKHLTQKSIEEDLIDVIEFVPDDSESEDDPY